MSGCSSFLARPASPRRVLVGQSRADLAGIGSSPARARRAPAIIDVTLSDAGCEPRSIAAKAGPTTFQVTNDGTDGRHRVRDRRRQQDPRRGRERHPRAGPDFSLDLKPGSYTTNCPGGRKFDKGTLEVAERADRRGGRQPRHARAAVQTYLNYVKGEADQLVPAVGPFAAAVKAGDVETAKNLFAADPRTTTRRSSRSPRASATSTRRSTPARATCPTIEWGGFHRIEKALWADNDLDGMAPVADKLVADVKDAAHADRHDRARAGADRQRRGRTAQRGVGLEDHRRGGPLQPHRPVRLRGQRRRRRRRRSRRCSRCSPPTRRLAAPDRPALRRRADRARHPYKGTDPTGNGYVLYTALDTRPDTRRCPQRSTRWPSRCRRSRPRSLVRTDEPREPRDRSRRAGRLGAGRASAAGCGAASASVHARGRAGGARRPRASNRSTARTRPASRPRAGPAAVRGLRRHDRRRRRDVRQLLDGRGRRRPPDDRRTRSAAPDDAQRRAPPTTPARRSGSIPPTSPSRSASARGCSTDGDDRFGLAGRRPAALVDLPRLPGRRPRPEPARRRPLRPGVRRRPAGGLPRHPQPDPDRPGHGRAALGAAGLRPHVVHDVRPGDAAQPDGLQGRHRQHHGGHDRLR